MNFAQNLYRKLAQPRSFLETHGDTCLAGTLNAWQESGCEGGFMPILAVTEPYYAKNTRPFSEEKRAIYFIVPFYDRLQVLGRDGLVIWAEGKYIGPALPEWSVVKTNGSNSGVPEGMSREHWAHFCENSFPARLIPGKTPY